MSGRRGFQREVSMGGGASRSWEHDRDTLHRTDSHSRRCPRLPRRERGGGHHPPRPRGGLRVRRADAGPVPLPLRAVEGWEGPGQEVPRQGHRLLGRPADPADRAAAPHGPHPRPPAAPSGAALRHGLHDRRRAAAGRGGRGRGPALGTGDEADPVAHAPRLRRQALRASGGDLERPHLQPARPPGVPDRPDHVPDDAGRAVADRAAAQAPAGGPSGLRARRHRAQRRPRRREGGPTSSTWSTK